MLKRQKPTKINAAQKVAVIIVVVVKGIFHNSTTGNRYKLPVHNKVSAGIESRGARRELCTLYIELTHGATGAQQHQFPTTKIQKE